ncbi:hypothetical protein BDW59DRAFT_178546 [Aspergillus cavernicola]|uniref:DEAD/DEAH box helicase n=1 Tax=Aspergillus cavernicola TaxID=176166 RepID=A0ABR4IN45_9EURO
MADYAKLLGWFKTLPSRTLDLVGDYAGNELFLIEGDSLLLHCFSDDSLDLSHGLQLLHAASLVERFLAQLHQRKCVFHIVFFANHVQACIPADAGEAPWSRYLAAREAILQHLLQNLVVAVPSIQVRCFDTYESDDFQQYLHSVGAYFLMCHDGTYSVLEKEHGHPDEPDDSEISLSDCDDPHVSDTDESVNGVLSEVWPTKVILRSMIHWFVCHGYNISIVNSLECRDSKVLSMILEGSIARARQVYDSTPSTSELPSDPSISSPEMDDDFPDMGLLDLNSEEALQGQKLKTSLSHPVSTFEDDDRYGYEVMGQNILDDVFKIVKEQRLELTQREWATVISLGVMSQSSLFDSNGLLGACAMLLHTAILSECKLSERAVVKRSATGEPFLEMFADTMANVLTSRCWREMIVQMTCDCDLADAIDGRLFLETLRALQKANSVHTFGPSILERFQLYVSIVSRLFSINIQPVAETGSEAYGDAPKSRRARTRRTFNGKNVMSVLPFSNPIIDPHLWPVSVVIDDSVDDKISSSMSRIFQELSHWHNHKRLLNTRANLPLTERQKMFVNRRNQFFMADVTRYAGSLTNSAGGSLKPEPVFVKTRNTKQLKRVQKELDNTAQGKAVDPKINQAASAGNKKGIKHGKLAVRDQIAAQQRSKQDIAFNKHLAAWNINVASFDKVTDHVTRYVQVKDHLSSLSAERRIGLEAEILAYIVSTLVNAWKGKCDTCHRDSSIQIVALIWHTIQQIARLKHGVTQEIAECIQSTVRALKLPAIDLPYQDKRQMSFAFAHFAITQGDISIALSPTEFQLIHAGPYLDRSMGSAPDPRVHDFEPDRWQRDVLDQIDARRSLFVVAPTSAGKTFISFYAIRQVLEDDNDGVLVYVAPTKALVNQIAAEVQARFSKSFNNTPGKSVWAIHTRDYRINNPTGCQVLITVPHILQIMLLAPTNARSWSSRVKRIIFDEVHCIGQAEDGVIWEQLLLLSPCPIIALSATVGNPMEFREWLDMTQKANGLELRMIEHKTRYSDLRKYIHQPPKKFVFNGLSSSPQLAPLGLDSSPNMAFVHPVASLIDRARGLPHDLTLEPRDCFTLWEAMKRHSTEMFPVDESLDPSIALPRLIKKADVIEWETCLKTLLKHWMDDNNSPIESVVMELSESGSSCNGLDVQVSLGELEPSTNPSMVRQSNIIETTLPLICSLHDQGALPALIFNYDRSYCEKTCEHLLTELEESEDRWKASDPAWKKKIAKFLEWQKMKVKQTGLKEPKKQKKKKGGRNDDDDDDDEKISQAELAREVASKDSSVFESFNPEDPISRFHLANEKKLTPSEFEAYATELRAREIPERFITALRRGIGVHHAGMNRKYRQVCEILFRKGYLRVVIATGTLALGINMPCKTVVFSGDSVFLTALNFRQAAGRAGRRGFDFLGNVVFQGISYLKVCRLLSSKLPDLNGHFPITTSLVLRLFILLNESKGAPYAVKAINSILSCPRIYLGGPESKHTVLHHLRFSIEYLRRNSLLDRDGAPLNFSGTIAHLYYTENSSFAFHALLSEGYFHRLSNGLRRKPKETLRNLMLVMSHLFGRYHLRPSILESRKNRSKSTSVVVLPPLPGHAAKILHNHNQKTLNICSAYVTTFVDQHIHGADRMLPLTGIKYGGDKSAEEVSTSMEFLGPTRVNSAFAALSGHRDEWKSIPELCKMVRGGVWLEQSVIPHIQISPEKGQGPLNAYLYDFYKHGNTHALRTENMIRRGDLWFLLNDFSLVLATIVTSLENFMKLSPGADPDLLETMGSGDAFEEDVDDRAFGAAEGPSMLTNLPKEQPSSSTPATRLVKPKKVQVADNWDDNFSDDGDKEDLASESDGDGIGKSGRKKNKKKSQNQPKVISSGSDSEKKNADAVLEGQGLLQVLKAFKTLQDEFNAKFKVIWA